MPLRADHCMSVLIDQSVIYNQLAVRIIELNSKLPLTLLYNTSRFGRQASYQATYQAT